MRNDYTANSCHVRDPQSWQLRKADYFYSRPRYYDGHMGWIRVWARMEENTLSRELKELFKWLEVVDEIKKKEAKKGRVKNTKSRDLPKIR